MIQGDRESQGTTGGGRTSASRSVPGELNALVFYRAKEFSVMLSNNRRNKRAKRKLVGSIHDHNLCNRCFKSLCDENEHQQSICIPCWKHIADSVVYVGDRNV
jgi:hypothetical protein